MGKTKQVEKKFDRNVEISAPILDPEIIRAIHSPPKDQKLNVRHGGFRALLSDLNSQDSTDELTPITENHLPSYIGISCAVSGYSNYSSYGKKLLEDPSRLDATARATSQKLAAASSRLNRSHTNSPVAVRSDQPNIHHVTIDKSHVNSIEQERKELTQKLTASATERRRSPSPIPPTEDDRHHGAYVGARYFPMPEPSKTVQKHIPLLGIDDEINPDEIVTEDVNKVEHKIASLYGDDFVEDWKESMSHKSRKEHHDDTKKLQQADAQATKNLKDLVTLKPTPTKQEEIVVPIDVPTPNIKVLAGVEKQFLNRLLTDENPPMPKSPSPQPMSPVSPKFSASNFKRVDSPPQKNFTRESPVASPEPRSPTPPPPPPKQEEILQDTQAKIEELPKQEDPPTLDLVEQPRSPTPPRQVDTPEEAIFAPNTPDLGHTSDEQELEREAHLDSLQSQEQPTQAPSSYEPEPELLLEPESLIELSEDQEVAAANSVHQSDLIITSDPHESQHMNQAESLEALDISTSVATDDNRPGNEEIGELVLLGEEEQQSQSHLDDLLNQPESPDSQNSTSTIERNPVEAPSTEEINKHENLLEEFDIKPQTPVQEVSSDLTEDTPDQQEDPSLVGAQEVTTRETDNLVSFSPEPTAETNNNVESQVKGATEIEAASEKYSPELASIQEAAETVAEIVAPTADLIAESAADSSTAVENKIDGNYFLNLLKSEESFIMEQVRKAEEKLAEHGSEMDEDKLGKMHSAIGKANLLINKKCNQFRGLCEQSLAGTGNEQYAVLSDDLAGFWDMISIQIADVRKSLENL